MRIQRKKEEEENSDDVVHLCELEGDANVIEENRDTRASVKRGTELEVFIRRPLVKKIGILLNDVDHGGLRRKTLLARRAHHFHASGKSKYAALLSRPPPNGHNLIFLEKKLDFYNFNQ